MSNDFVKPEVVFKAFNDSVTKAMVGMNDKQKIQFLKLLVYAFGGLGGFPKNNS